MKAGAIIGLVIGFISLATLIFVVLKFGWFVIKSLLGLVKKDVKHNITGRE